jgi:hypothetical protein
MPELRSNRVPTERVKAIRLCPFLIAFDHLLIYPAVAENEERESRKRQQLDKATTRAEKKKKQAERDTQRLHLSEENAGMFRTQ